MEEVIFVMTLCNYSTKGKPESSRYSPRYLYFIEEEFKKETSFITSFVAEVTKKQREILHFIFNTMQLTKNVNSNSSSNNRNKQ